MRYLSISARCWVAFPINILINANYSIISRNYHNITLGRA